MKAAAVDGRTVVVGSMNWSFRGESVNDENTLIFRSPALAMQFETFFATLWDSNPRVEGHRAADCLFDLKMRTDLPGCLYPRQAMKAPSIARISSIGGLQPCLPIRTALTVTKTESPANGTERYFVSRCNLATD